MKISTKNLTSSVYTYLLIPLLVLTSTVSSSAQVLHERNFSLDIGLGVPLSLPKPNAQTDRGFPFIGNAIVWYKWIPQLYIGIDLLGESHNLDTFGFKISQGTLQDSNVSALTSSLLPSIRFRYPITETLSPFVDLGAGMNFNAFNPFNPKYVTTLQVNEARITPQTIGYKVGAGIEFPIDKDMSFLLSVNYRTNPAKLSIKQTNGSVIEQDFHLDTLYLSIGGCVYF
jgi:hypothetical protein